MPLIKAITVVFIRDRMGKVDSETRNTFYAKLSRQEKDSLKKSLAFTKIPVALAVKVYDAAASVLHPGKLDGAHLLGRALAQDNLTGIYKVLLRFVSIPFLIKQSAKIWDTYHEFGIARCARVKNENEIVLIIEDYPDMPKTIREGTTGYIEGALELTGGTNIHVELDDTNCHLWKWRVTWGLRKKKHP
ncbi:hypothetical protein K8S19_13695 [bacterium]|nr:hypothetical protein [bacterium]